MGNIFNKSKENQPQQETNKTFDEKTADVITKAEENAQATKESAIEAKEDVKHNIEDKIDNAKNAVSKTVDQTNAEESGRVASYNETISEAAKNAGEAVGSVAAKAKERFASAVGSDNEDEGEPDSPAVLDGVASAFSEAFEGAKNKASGFAFSTKEKVKEVKDSISQSASDEEDSASGLIDSFDKKLNIDADRSGHDIVGQCASKNTEKAGGNSPLTAFQSDGAPEKFVE